MKRFIITLLVLIVIVAGALIIGRNEIVRNAVVYGIRQTAGLKTELGGVDIGLFKPRVQITNLKVYNPASFSGTLMFDIPEISVEYDPQGLLKGNVHLRALVITVRELDIVQDPKMNLNVNSLAILAPKQQSGGKAPQVTIDQLALRIDKVAYQNELLGAAVGRKEFNPNINETFSNVTDPKQVASQVMLKVLAQIGLANKAQFLQNVPAVEKFKTQAEDLMNQASQGLQKVFGQ